MDSKNTFFAVETRDEPDKVVTEVVVRTAHALALKISKIEVLNRFSLGSTKFLRFRTQGSVNKLLDRLFEDGRCVVGAEGTGFVARVKGRKGVVSPTLMLATAVNSIVYRGPGAPFWERQFGGK